MWCLYCICGLVRSVLCSSTLVIQLKTKNTSRDSSPSCRSKPFMPLFYLWNTKGETDGCSLSSFEAWWRTCLWLYFGLISLSFLSDVEEKSMIFSMDQTESLFKPQHLNRFFSPCKGGLGREPGEVLFTNLKDEPEDLNQLAPTPGDTIISLDFGENGLLFVVLDLYRVSNG